jgi:oligoendopeptidase F
MNAVLPHWDLSQSYAAGSAELMSDMELLRGQVNSFVAKYNGVVPERGLPVEDFLAALAALEQITRLSCRLEQFASLCVAQSVEDQKAQAQLVKMDTMMSQMDNEIMFFRLWWKGLPDAEAEPLLAAAPCHAYMLSPERAFRPHPLAAAEEKIINLKDVTGSMTLKRLYEMITNSFRFKTDFLPPEQRSEPVNRETLSVYFRNPSPEVRAGAYQELYRVFGEQGPHLAQFYQGLCGDWQIEKIQLRRHSSAIGARNKSNDLSDETVESLLRVCRKQAPLVFGSYFKMKAARLGLEKLRRYDVYAPVHGAEKKYSFEEGLSLVENAFRAFDGEFADLALRVHQEKRLTASLDPHKQSGAFCSSSCPGDTPWVLMSFTSLERDLFTLAHELGHAVHSQLAADHSVFHFHSALPLAETASTFGEMLLSSHLSASLSGQEKEGLKFTLLDDAYATVGRQAFFSIFEMEAHRLIQEGATPDELSDVYLANLKEQFGDAVEVSDEFRWEWVSIPHFYQCPFYVYAYSFGQLLVYSLWRLYEKEGPSFVPRLKSILAKGGSDSPEKILSQAGVGPLDDDFWTGGFEVIKSFIPE